MSDDATSPEAPPRSTLGQTPHEPTVRPWELELLISGAVTFALLQLPGPVDEAFRGAQPHLDVGAGMAVFLVYYALKLVLYALIGCFVLHLCVRAYWVGLIGLESVFPKGVQWEETNLGPVAREVYRARLTAVQPMIDRADRVASVVFSSAFMLVFMVGFGVVMGTVASGVTWVVSRLLLGGRNYMTVFIAVIALFSLTPAVIALVDKRYGDRLGPRGQKALRRATLGAFYMSAMPLYGTTVVLLTGGKRRRWASAALGAAFIALVSVFMVKDVLLARGTLRYGGYAFVPDQAGRFGADPAYYRSQRREGEGYEDVPSIQSDVVGEPYVRLFIPYYPTRHNHALPARCPGLPRAGESALDLGAGRPAPEAVQRAVLECWTRVQRVTLNGRSLSVPFRFSADPETGARGIVAHIATAGLPRGENVLTVERTPRRSELASPPKVPREPHYIPFWL